VLLNHRELVSLRQLIVEIMQSYWEWKVTLYFAIGSQLWILFGGRGIITALACADDAIWAESRVPARPTRKYRLFYCRWHRRLADIAG